MKYVNLFDCRYIPIMLFRNGTTFKIYTVEILLDKLAVLNRWIYSNEAASYKTSNSSTTFFMGRRLLILTDRVTLNAQLITRRLILFYFLVFQFSFSVQG